MMMSAKEILLYWKFSSYPLVGMASNEPKVASYNGERIHATCFSHVAEKPANTCMI